MTLRDTLTAAGFQTEEKILAFAKLLIVGKGLDDFLGIRPSDDKLDEEAQKLLQQEINLKWLNEQLQKNWFKKYRGDGERQQAVPASFDENDLKKITTELKTLGFIDEVLPSKHEYDQAWVFGATEVGMKGRIEELSKLISGGFFNENRSEGGCKVKSIAILSGARDLWLDSDSDPSTAELILKKILEKDRFLSSIYGTEISIESIKKEGQVAFDQAKADFTETDRQSGKIPKNETPEQKTKRENGYLGLVREAVVKFFEEKYEIKYPTEADAARKLADDFLKEHTEYKGEIIVVDAPKKVVLGSDGNPEIDKNGKKITARPDTTDTILQWAKDNQKMISLLPEGEKISVIAISNQPVATGQKTGFDVAEAQNQLLQKIDFEVVGKELDLKGKVSIDNKQELDLKGKVSIDNKQASSLLPEVAGTIKRLRTIEKIKQEQLGQKKPESSPAIKTYIQVVAQYLPCTIL